MEIHPPAKHMESVKDYLIHLSMMTIGLLLALGLDQAVEAHRHHELAEQAKESIVSEIRDNKKEIDSERPRVAHNVENLKHSLAVIEQLLAHRKLTAMEITIGASGASLNSTAWTTASSTGAFAYMGYAEAKRFARSYQIQTILEHVQDDALRLAGSALAPVKFSSGGPDKLSDEQLRNVDRDILSCLAQAAMWSDIADQLVREYDRVLGGH